MRSHFGLARLLSHFMGSASRTLVFGCFAGARFAFASLNVSLALLIVGLVPVAVFPSGPGLFAAMFRDLPGLVFTLSRSSAKFLCARACTPAVLLALLMRISDSTARRAAGPRLGELPLARR